MSTLHEVGSSALGWLKQLGSKAQTLALFYFFFFDTLLLLYFGLCLIDRASGL